MMLKYLKDQLLTFKKDTIMKATEFDWVITVPAIWKPRGKQKNNVPWRRKDLSTETAMVVTPSPSSKKSSKRRRMEWY